jgi:hypothetical protein
MPRKIAAIVPGIMLAGALSLSAAGSPVIGMVSSDAGQAGVLIDGTRVSPNATLFEGSEVASPGYSRVRLNSGTRVDLGANSVVRIYADHASLEGGASEVQGPLGYAIDARSLRIQPSEAASVARVRLDGSQRVLVTALGAPVNVWNKEGLLVARVLPETPMSFLPTAGAANAFSDSGCVVNKSNVAVLVDQTGNQVFDLRSSVKGVDPNKFVGKRASVSGTLAGSATPAAGANQVVNVNAISLTTGGDCALVAARIGGTMTLPGMSAVAAVPASAPGAAVVSGMSPVVLGGVIAGVGAVAVVAGLAAAGAFSNSSP